MCVRGWNDGGDEPAGGCGNWREGLSENRPGRRAESSSVSGVELSTVLGISSSSSIWAGSAPHGVCEGPGLLPPQPVPPRADHPSDRDHA